ncbi:MAG: D-alanine--D-alanine ligase [Candidatus Taylorbacteria bacterium]
MNHRTRVGVLRGGPSTEYEVSINSGATVLSALRNHHENRYQARDIFIDRSGVWHIDGIQTKPEEIVNSVDIVFNALHGSYGEDGKVQSFLEHHGKTFTGSGSLASAIGMNKILSKKAFRDNGVKTPMHMELSSDYIPQNTETIVKELFQTLLLPAIVKPCSSGSSIGVTVVRSYDDIAKALLEAAKHSPVVMIEEFIPGIEATCAVIESFRDQELYALPPIEIRHSSQFFDYKSKYDGQSMEIVPATFADKFKHAIETTSKKVHKALGLKHYSRSDFIIHPKRGIYVLEVNTLPGLTENSLLPKALVAVGSDMPEFVSHVIELSRDN